MNPRTPIVALALTLAAPLPALATCGVDDAVDQRGQLAREVHQATDSDPKQAAQVNKELRQDKPETSARPGTDECAAAERRAREVERAGSEAERKTPNQ
ncbi:hypothetical protein ACM792_12810 [Metapseudomonas otitidis]|uniref:hypothetical protein n=1 Tax=Metapseudomonas otitidis TaxID=319939 RepID=UPI0039FC4E40